MPALDPAWNCCQPGQWCCSIANSAAVQKILQGSIKESGYTRGQQDCAAGRGGRTPPLLDISRGQQVLHYWLTKIGVMMAALLYW